MTQRVDAIFENGIFRPQTPVDIAEGQRVSLEFEAAPASPEDDGDLLDTEYIDECQQQAASAPSLEDVKKLLSGVPGSLAERISQERDER